MNALLIDRCVKRSQLAQQLLDAALRSAEHDDLDELVAEAIELSRLLTRAWGIYTETFFTPGVGDLTAFVESLDAATAVAFEIARSIPTSDLIAIERIGAERDALRSVQSNAPRLDVGSIDRQAERARADYAAGRWQSIEDALIGAGKRHGE